MEKWTFESIRPLKIEFDGKQTYLFRKADNGRFLLETSDDGLAFALIELADPRISFVAGNGVECRRKSDPAFTPQELSMRCN